MNAPYPNFAVAQKLFDRAIPTFTSQADRDEQIAKLSAAEQAHIYASLLTNDELAFKISDDMPGWISTEKMAKMVRATLSGDMDTVREILLSELDEAVKREAESVALESVEA